MIYSTNLDMGPMTATDASARSSEPFTIPKVYSNNTGECPTLQIVLLCTGVGALRCEPHEPLVDSILPCRRIAAELGSPIHTGLFFGPHVVLLHHLVHG